MGACRTQASISIYDDPSMTRDGARRGAGNFRLSGPRVRRSSGFALGFTLGRLSSCQCRPNLRHSLVARRRRDGVAARAGDDRPCSCRLCRGGGRRPCLRPRRRNVECAWQVRDPHHHPWHSPIPSGSCSPCSGSGRMDRPTFTVAIGIAATALRRRAEWTSGRRIPSSKDFADAFRAPLKRRFLELRVPAAFVRLSPDRHLTSALGFAWKWR